MNTQEIENIYIETLACSMLFYRDTTLKEEYISKYTVSKILQEKGFCDMSYMGGGLTGNLRFLIATNKGKDLSSIDPDVAKYGFILLPSESYFKILDIYKIGAKTQILLIHIQKEFIDFFKTSTSNIEERAIEMARANFEEKINSPTIDALNSEYWKERIEKPVGMYPFSMDPNGTILYV